MREILTLISLLFCAVSIAQTTPYDDLRLASTDSDRLIAHKAISTHLIDLFTTSSSIEDLKLNVTDWPFGFATSGEDEDWALVLTWNSKTHQGSKIMEEWLCLLIMKRSLDSVG